VVRVRQGEGVGPGLGKGLEGDRRRRRPSQTPQAWRPPSRASNRRGRAAPAGAPLLSKARLRGAKGRGARRRPIACDSHLAWSEHGDHGGACHGPQREVHANHVAHDVHGLDEGGRVLKVVHLCVEEGRVGEARHERRDRANGEAVLRVERQLALANGEQAQLGSVLQGSLVGVEHRVACPSVGWRYRSFGR
jgi:hypothetical protein